MTLDRLCAHRQGAIIGVQDLSGAIQTFIDGRNDRPQPVVWTGTADQSSSTSNQVQERHSHDTIGKIPMPTLKQATVARSSFNVTRSYPYSLKPWHFEAAMRTVYDFMQAINNHLVHELSLQRLEDILRPANLSGTLSDMLTDALANASAGILTTNLYHNGHQGPGKVASAFSTS